MNTAHSRLAVDGNAFEWENHRRESTNICSTAVQRICHIIIDRSYCINQFIADKIRIFPCTETDFHISS